MKLSKTQQNLMNELNNVLAVVDKYETHEEFFDNSKDEQRTLTTAFNLNDDWNSSEKFKAKDLEGFNEMSERFYNAKNKRILIVYAKTETVKALERNGLVEVVRPPYCKGAPELVKVL